jgi:transposase-like protein
MSKIVETDFNFNDAVQDIMNGKNISGKDGVLAPLVKQLVEAALEAELESHITQDVFTGNKNRKNGTSSKTIKTEGGEFILDTPRDRAGSFEPQLVKKNQTHLTDDIEQKVLSMYALGLSYRDIVKHIEDMYKICKKCTKRATHRDSIRPPMSLDIRPPMTELIRPLCA